MLPLHLMILATTMKPIEQMEPRRIVTIDRMPLSASGKIDRKALKQRLEDSRAGGG